MKNLQEFPVFDSQWEAYFQHLDEARNVTIDF